MTGAMPQMKWDGHTHTQFCRHGSGDLLETYLNRAISQGFERYSVTEHPPLPAGWLNDLTVMNQLAMPGDELSQYFDHVYVSKVKYEGQLQVLAGIELDFLPGHESFTQDIVTKFESKLEDLIVSVHYLPGRDGMRCIDLSPDDFVVGLIDYYGSMERVIDEYYQHVEQAILFAATLPGRKRLGHINLIEKFRTALPPIEDEQINTHLKRLIPVIEAAGIGIDVNLAGMRKDTCGKPYAPSWFVEDCVARGIECVYGSDAHHPQDVGANYDVFDTMFTQINTL